MTELLNIISDIHCEEDLLGFEQYVDTISRMITHKDFRTPFCIGIFGKWGTGKTSFMHLLENRLLIGKSKPYIIPVWFNPWRYQKEEHLIIPFLKAIEHGINGYLKKNQSLGKTLINKLKTAALKTGEASAAFAYGIKADCKLGGFGFTLDVSKAVNRQENLAEQRLEDAKNISDKLTSIYYEIVDELKSSIDETHFRVAAFIDDLDRCLPDKAVELLEAIKLFLDIQGYLFVLGVDRDVVKKGIAYRYRHFEYKEQKEEESLIIAPEDYLDKMIQLPLELPKIESGRKRKYIESLLGKARGFREHADLIDIGAGDNPRTLKRFINLLAFTAMHADTVRDNILNDNVDPIESDEHKNLIEKYFMPILYIKWTIIVYRYPQIHNDIKGYSMRLIEIQEASRDKKQPESEEDQKEEKKTMQVPDRLKMVLARGEQFPDDVWLIERFIYLTESTITPEDSLEALRGYGVTYEPGDMVRIPKGKFLYGEEKIEMDLDYDYFIDVFPVTNKQYKEFIGQTGYDVPYREGEEYRPYNWDKESREYPKGLGKHPVVLVTHEDVEAFCKWRSKKEGPEIRLPTEEEWEKAARGRDGREFPWGNEFDFKKLNCADFHVQKVLKDRNEWDKVFYKGFYEKNKDQALTSEVDRFEAGASPHGCKDMAGNVWEWTSSLYKDTKTSYVLRGGSWLSLAEYCRCSDRDWSDPYYGDCVVGFRCARPVTL